MDIFTVLISLCLGFAGTLIFGGLLNIPDAGAIIAIAFIGGRIIYLLEKITGIPKNNGEANEKLTFFRPLVFCVKMKKSSQNRLILRYCEDIFLRIRTIFIRNRCYYPAFSICRTRLR